MASSSVTPLGLGAESSSGVSDETLERTRKRSRVIQPDAKDKNLRNFSLRVAEKVEFKQSTSYAEVADELVAEYVNSEHLDAQQADTEERNVRRRVYDALNVLIALDIASKDRAKGIHWKGFPTRAMDSAALQKAKADAQQRIANKEKQLQDVLSQHIAYQQLLIRNRERQQADAEAADPGVVMGPSTLHEHRLMQAAGGAAGGAAGSATGGAPAGSASAAGASGEAAIAMPPGVVAMPFIICHTRAGGKIDVQLSPDRRDAIVTFTDAFQLYDDNDLLRLRGFHSCDPAKLERYVTDPEMLRYTAQYPQYQALRALPQVGGAPAAVTPTAPK